MKSHNSPVRRSVLLAAAISLLALAGCGQKGPLYMPRVPPDPLAQTAPKPGASTTDAAGATDAAAKPGDAAK